MEKELFISTLKGKTGVDNLSERTIDEVAAMFLPQFADDEKITEESWNFPVQVIKTMSGQLRHDLSLGVNTFKTQYEADNKAANAKAIEDAIAAAKAEWEKGQKAEPTKAEPTKTEPEPDIDKKIADAMAKAMEGLAGENGALGKLSKQFSDYMVQVAEEKKAQVVTNARDLIRDYLISRGVDEDDYALEITLEKLQIGEKPDIDALKAKAEKDYEAIFKRMHKNDGGHPFNGGAGGSTDSNTEFQNYIKGKQAEAQQEAKDAEELRKHMM